MATLFLLPSQHVLHQVSHSLDIVFVVLNQLGQPCLGGIADRAVLPVLGGQLVDRTSKQITSAGGGRRRPRGEGSHEPAIDCGNSFRTRLLQYALADHFLVNRCTGAPPW
jgi:hypothetical protein